MNNKEFMKRVVYTIALLLVFSCSNELSHEVKSLEESRTELILERLTAMGFDTEGYQIIDNDIVVEGDIALSIDDILSDSSRQYYHDRGIVSQNNIANINIKLDSAMSTSSWIAALNEVINTYNSVPNCKLRMKRVSSSSTADIRIYYDEIGDWYGQATFPNGNGKTGYGIRINEDCDSMTHHSKMDLLAHEIGHNIGLRHMNKSEDGIIHIHGTPTTNRDYYSIMNQGMSNTMSSWHALSINDKKGLEALYPLTSNTPYVDLYEHSDFRGRNYRLFESCNQLPYNDTLSSMKFYNGAHIWVYEHTNYGGKRYGYKVYTWDYRDHWFNDKASSILFNAWQESGETILNKTFSNTSDWNQSSMYHYSKPDQLYSRNFAISGKCEAYISGGVLHTYVSDRGSNTEDIYFKTNDLIFDNRFTYEVSFKARTEQGQSRYIKVAVGEGLDFNPYEEEDIKITGSMETFSFTFRPDKYTSNGTLMFYMGDTRWDSWSKDVVLDDIKITRR